MLHDGQLAKQTSKSFIFIVTFCTYSENPPGRIVIYRGIIIASSYGVLTLCQMQFL